MNNIIKVHNPNNLPTISYKKLIDFQGDLKGTITQESLEKMRNSLKKHGVFLPKFVWFDERQCPNILDGHQTKKTLSSLEEEGWTIPEIPYVIVEAIDRDDAAEKLLQINSRYAMINPETTWFDDFNLSNQALSDLFSSVEIPEIDPDNFLDEISFDVPEQPYKSALPSPENLRSIKASEDGAMLPTPLENFQEDNSIQVERGRVILVFENEEQLHWIESTLKISIKKVIYTVSEVRKY